MSIFIDTLTGTVTDALEDECESDDEKADILARVIDSLTHYRNDLTGTPPAAYRATADRAGLGVMADVLDVVADRENVSGAVLAALTVEQLTDLYTCVVEPAIDRLERSLLDEPGQPGHAFHRLTVYRTADGRDAHIVLTGSDDLDADDYRPVTNSDGHVRLAYLSDDGTEAPVLETTYGWADPATLTSRPEVTFSPDTRRCTITTTDAVYVLEMDGDIPTILRNGRVVGTLSLDDSTS